MIIKRKTNNRYNNDESIRVKIDLQTFNILCRYILSPPAYLRMNHITNLHKLISNLDMGTYENDPDKIKRIQFIRRGIEARRKYNLVDQSLILNHICSGLDYEVDFLDFDRIYLSPDEISWCHQMVSETIQYSFVYKYSNKLIDLCTRILTSDYSHRGTLIQEFESIIDDIKNQFRKSKSEDNLTNMTFSLQSGILEQCIQDTWNLITNPSRRLATGMQGFNEMIGGGFESGRVYMLVGATSVGKSITLLNLAYQIKKYNTNYQTKDPSKRPCVVILTMENTVVETITRLFDMAVESSHGIGMENYTPEEIINLLRTEGQLHLDENSPIDIVIKYKPNRSVDTSYLYALCDDLEDQGYEVICMIQDHVKRIRSIDRNPDLRIELGDIVNEFKSFAAEKDIPIISNTHLNREAIRILEEAKQKTTKTDITKKLGKSYGGESMLMFDNIDVGVIINLDFDEENNRYMVFKLDKMRDKTERDYIAQPFAYSSTIRLLEDVGGLPMFKESLHMNEDVPRIASIRTSSANVMANISNVIPPTHSNNNLFSDENELYDIPEPDDTPIEEPVIRRKVVPCPIFFMRPPVNKPSFESIRDLKESLAQTQ